MEKKAEILNKEKATGILIGLGNEGNYLSKNFWEVLLII